MKNTRTYFALVILAFVAVVSIMSIFSNATERAAIERERVITEYELSVEHADQPTCDCDGLHCQFGEPSL